MIPAGQQTIVFACTRYGELTPFTKSSIVCFGVIIILIVRLYLHRHHVEFIHQLLERAGILGAPVYGNLDPAARKINVAKFKAKKCHVLIVTDIAARGIGK